LYCALIGFIHYEAADHEKNLNSLVEMINSMEVREEEETYKNAVDYLFEDLAEKEPNHFAVRQYAKYKLAAGKTAKSILISCGARLATFDIKEVREVISYKGCKWNAPKKHRRFNRLRHERELLSGGDTKICSNLVRICRIFRPISAEISWRNVKHHNRLRAGKGAYFIMEISYEKVGEYLLPTIILKDSPDCKEKIKPLGRYGRMHKAYLREQRSILYNQLLLTERLYPLCREIDEAAQNRITTIGNCETAHEVILSELVFM
jgi:hypothetical protein